MTDIMTQINNSDSLGIDLGMDDTKQYNILLNLTAQRSGMSTQEIETGMKKIAYHESKGDSSKIQESNVYNKQGQIIGVQEGPGAGQYQYERGEKFGGKNAGRRAVNRLYNYMGGDILKGKAPDYYPEWLEQLFPKTKEGYLMTDISVDLSKLTAEQQNMIFLADKLGQPDLDWQGFGTGEWAAEYHYAGPDSAGYVKRYEEDMKSLK